MGLNLLIVQATNEDIDLRIKINLNLVIIIWGWATAPIIIKEN